MDESFGRQFPVPVDLTGKGRPQGRGDRRAAGRRLGVYVQ